MRQLNNGINLSTHNKKVLTELVEQLKIMCEAANKILDLELDNGEHPMNELPTELMDLYPFGLSFDEFEYEVFNYVDNIRDTYNI